MVKEENLRSKKIIKTSALGIIVNFMLAGFKAIVGLLSNSIAIVLDAVNNLSDALSSTITIIGTKLAGKKPDKQHPFGHGRIEYLSSMIIAVIILYAGIASLVESIKKIIVPQTPDYSVAAIIVVSVAIIVKIVLGLFFKKVGKNVHSDSLIGSGNDALMDSIISTATLISAILFIIFGLSLEAYLGVIIAFFIFKTGYSMLKSAISQILGERVEKNITISVKQTVSSFENVFGAYDLVLDNYGPDIYLGSIHIEIPDTMTAIEIDDLTRKITREVYSKHNVILTAIGIYSINTTDEEVQEMKSKILDIVHSHSSVLQMHGFYFNKNDNVINFDIILDFADEDRQKTYQEVYDEVQKQYPDMKIQITMDIDVSD